MSATLDHNPIPRHAVPCWLTDNHLFVAIPLKGKAPFIARYANSAEGFREAMQAMRSYHAPLPPKPIYTPPPQITARLRNPGPLSSDARLALAQDILRRLLITPKG